MPREGRPPFQLVPLGIFKHVLGEPEVREAVLLVLQKGPHEAHELAAEARAALGRDSLRTAQVQPVLAQLSDRGFVTAARSWGHRLYSLTVRGHDLANRISSGESFDDAASAVGSRRARRSRDVELDDETRSQIARILVAAYKREGFPLPTELSEAARQGS